MAWLPGIVGTCRPHTGVEGGGGRRGSMYVFRWPAANLLFPHPAVVCVMGMGPDGRE